jgi:hypothetical protein
MYKALRSMSVAMRDRIKEIHKDELAAIKLKAIEVVNKLADLEKEAATYFKKFINDYPASLHNNEEGLDAELELYFAYLVNDEEYQRVIKPLSQQYVDFCNINVELIKFGIVERMSENYLRKVALGILEKEKGLYKIIQPP